MHEYQMKKYQRLKMGGKCHMKPDELEPAERDGPYLLRKAQRAKSRSPGSD
jgi:hypothetical protein